MELSQTIMTCKVTPVTCSQWEVSYLHHISRQHLNIQAQLELSSSDDYVTLVVEDSQFLDAQGYGISDSIIYQDRSKHNAT